MGDGRVESPPGATVRDVDATPVAWREAFVGAADPSRRAAAFLHGLGGSRIAWEPQLEALAPGRLGLAWDMPGYGASAPLPAMTFPALADAAARWLTSAGAAPAHVVGLSMGGMVALHLVLSHPDLVRSLVLIDSSPAFGLDGSITAEAWIDARLARLREGATPATMAPGAIAAIAAPDASGAAVRLGVEAMARITPAAYEQAVRCLVTHDVRSRLATIDRTTLVIVGELDRETPLPFSEHLAAAIPGARLEVVPGAGHLSSLEQPDLINPLIADFLEEHD
jgi:3-oxoadipate enol-lactonase